MNNIYFIAFLSLFAFQFFKTDTSNAEPWLGSRMAKNCAGCHAPQRINLPAKKRRCSLSCQGCHVNPNGGGLRNQYGKWAENRWLKSMRSSWLSHKKNVKTYPEQNYGINKENWKKADDKLILEKGLPLVETSKEVDEDNYYWTYGRYKKTAENKKHQLYQVPEDDPYRQMGLSKFDGGGDVRLYSATNNMTINGEKEPEKWVSFPMVVDLGLRYRPFYRKLHFVMEQRFTGSPQPEATYEDLLKSGTTRSAYVMLDDLPYNVFAMGGYYRPLFGNYDPNHYALSQKMISQALQGNAQAYNLVYEAVSVGTAPNVPYLNLHKIGKKIGSKDDRTEGYAVNLGFRGVRLGQSLNYSYWNTKDTAQKINVEMHSLGGFIMLPFKTVLSYEGINLSRDHKGVSKVEGNVHTVESFVKTWKEVYWQSSYALSDVSANLVKGESSQLRTGIRAFLLPGLELSLYFESSENTDLTTATVVKSSGISSQVHAFF